MSGRSNSDRRTGLRNDDKSCLQVMGLTKPLATTLKFLKRESFRASPADHRRARGAKIHRPSDSRKSGRSTTSATRGARRGAGRLRPRRPRSGRVRAARGGGHGRGRSAHSSRRAGSELGKHERPLSMARCGLGGQNPSMAFVILRIASGFGARMCARSSRTVLAA
jgi:hypothetical protein